MQGVRRRRRINPSSVHVRPPRRHCSSPADKRQAPSIPLVMQIPRDTGHCKSTSSSPSRCHSSRHCSCRSRSQGLVRSSNHTGRLDTACTHSRQQSYRFLLDTSNRSNSSSPLDRNIPRSSCPSRTVSTTQSCSRTGQQGTRHSRRHSPQRCCTARQSSSCTRPVHLCCIYQRGKPRR